MASRFEPFLINPPKRLSGMRRRFRMNMSDPDSYASGDPALKGLPSKKTIQARNAAYARWAQSARKKAKSKKRRTKKVVKRRTVKRVAKRRVVRRRVVKKVVKRRSGISHAAAVKRGKKAARTRAMKGRKPMARRKGRKRVARRRSYVKHAKMRSQWWKMKRRIKRKGYAKKHKRHTIVAYKHRGHLYTSPFAKKVWANHRLNPFGAEMMTLGANPRRKRRTRRRSRKRYSSNPRRRYMARGRRRFSSNPLSSMGHLMPMIAAGTAGALAVKMIPRVVGVSTPWATYGTQAVVIVGGGYLADKFMGKSVSDGWVIGGATMILSNLASGLLGGVFAGLGLDYEAFPNEVGAFPMGMLGGGEMGASYGESEFEPSMVY